MWQRVGLQQFLLAKWAKEDWLFYILWFCGSLRRVHVFPCIESNSDCFVVGSENYLTLKSFSISLMYPIYIVSTFLPCETCFLKNFEFFIVSNEIFLQCDSSLISFYCSSLSVSNKSLNS